MTDTSNILANIENIFKDGDRNNDSTLNLIKKLMPEVVKIKTSHPNQHNKLVKYLSAMYDWYFLKNNSNNHTKFAKNYTHSNNLNDILQKNSCEQFEHEFSIIHSYIDCVNKLKSIITRKIKVIEKTDSCENDIESVVNRILQASYCYWKDVTAETDVHRIKEFILSLSLPPSINNNFLCVAPDKKIDYLEIKIFILENERDITSSINKIRTSQSPLYFSPVFDPEYPCNDFRKYYLSNIKEIINNTKESN